MSAATDNLLRPGPFAWSAPVYSAEEIARELGNPEREGRRGWKCLCPAHDDHEPSLSITEKGGKTLFCCRVGCSQDQVLSALQDRGLWPAGPRPAVPPRPKPKKANGGAEEEWHPIVPPPPDAPEPTAREKQWHGMSPKYTHEYFGDGDRLLHYVLRFEWGDINEGGKQEKTFRPLTYGRLNGKLGWHQKRMPEPLPLYRLNVLTLAAPGSTVIITEGELKCEAAERMFPDYICVAWQGGTPGAPLADLPPLAGMHAVVFGDADDPGRKAAQQIATGAQKVAASVRSVDTTGLPKGFDAADLEKLSCDHDEWLAARLQASTSPRPARGPTPDYECTLAELQCEMIEPIRWIVPDYIPEGLTVFAGRPKIGKSWLMLGVALGVARWTETLGKFVEKGDVLYCGLEDGKRRMQSRVAKVLGPAIKTWPANFTFRYRLDSLDAGGLDSIEQWLIEHPAGRLVVIDTLGKVRGMKQPREEQYQYDYRLLGALQELATRYRIAIVVVHHVRKGDAEDVLDTISGTTGIAGAADNLMVLGRHENGVRLYIRGRDTEEQDKLAEFDPDTGLWEVIGDLDDEVPGTSLQGLRRSIFDLLTGSPIPLTTAEIAARLQAPKANVQRTLSRMARTDPPQARRSTGKAGAYEAVPP